MSSPNQTQSTPNPQEGAVRQIVIEESSRKERAAAARLQNRAESYNTGAVVLRFYTYQDRETGESRPRVEFNISTQGVGMLVKLFGEQYRLPVLPVLNELWEENQESGEKVPVPIPMEIVHLLRGHGYVLIRDKYLVRKEVLEVLDRTFPRAVDARAYISGLCAPIVGGGFIRDCQVKYTTLQSTYGDQAIKAEADGSGLIHPKHGLYAKLGVKPEEACPIQIRGWRPDKGTFVKGVLFPDERAVNDDGLPDIWIDWLQVKGRMKGKAKAFAQEWKDIRSEIHLGVIRVWRTHGETSTCFEHWERVQDTPRNRRILETLTEQWMMRFIHKGGQQGIVKRLAERDPATALTVQLAEKAGFDPLQVPSIRTQVKDELGRDLWHLAQGAGWKGPSFVVRLDNGVEPGTCVVGPIQVPVYNLDGERIGAREVYRVGTKVACARMPMVLPQGLKVLTVAEPLPHHLVTGPGGRRVVPPATIILNPRDATLDMQGDDDGDEMLVEPDQRIVRLFRRRIDLGFGPDTTYLIEPEEAKVARSEGEVPFSEYLTLSEEGMDLMSRDGKSAVGLFTIQASTLLAVKKYLHALSWAVLIQYSIDAGKRIVRWLNLVMTAMAGNWRPHRSKPGLEPKKEEIFAGPAWIDETGYIRQDLVGQVLRTLMPVIDREEGPRGREKLIRANVSQVLSWRESGKDRFGVQRKKIDPETWRPCVTQLGEAEDWGNLVHHVHNYAHVLWRQHEKYLPKPRQVDLHGLLYRELGREPASTMGHELYARTLYAMSGIGQYRSAIHRIVEEGHEPEEKALLVQGAWQECILKLRKLTLEEILTIFTMELTCPPERPHDSPEKQVDRAMTAIVWPGSPVLERLGIQLETSCGFMHEVLYLDGRFLAEGRTRWATQEEYEAAEDQSHFRAVPRMEATRSWILRSVKTGQTQNVYLAAERAIGKSAEHLARTGKPMSKCKDCRDAVMAMTVIHARGREFDSKIRDAEKGLAKALIHAVNVEIKALLQD